MQAESPTYDTQVPKNLASSEVFDLFRFKTLLYHLIRRDVTSRYKRSVLGVAWTLLEPLVTMLIMAVIFTSFFGRTQRAYPLFLLTGLEIWTFIQQASIGSITGLLGGNWLLGKVYMPKTVFAVTSIGANLINLGFSFFPLTLFFIYYKMAVTPALLFLPFALLIIAIFTLGLGLLVSAFSILFADWLNIHTIFMRLLMYLSGIFYKAENMATVFQPVIKYNPTYCLIAMVREPILNGAMPQPWLITYSAAWAVFMFLLGAFVFLRISNQINYRI